MAEGVLVFAVYQGNLILKIQRAVIDDVGKIQDNFLFKDSRFGFPAKMSLKKLSLQTPCDDEDVKKMKFLLIGLIFNVNHIFLSSQI